MRPNVLLIVFDAARRDSVEPYGAPAGASPAVAQLASAGAALQEVYAAACWTAPSHGSMFTGLLPRAAGLARVPSPELSKSVLAEQRHRLLPVVLREAGYSTAAVSANLWFSRTSGFDVGFDEFESVDTGRQARLHGNSLRSKLHWWAEALRGRVDDGAREVEALMGRWLESGPRKPFFWFVNLIECHSPYLPPRPYGDASLYDRFRVAEDSRRWYTLDAIWRACVGGYDVPEESMARMRRLYAGAIRYMDDWLARLLERLEAAALLEDTLVIVTADHGENFGEGGFLTHAHSLDNRLIHVPFVWAGPGVGERGINSLVDLPRLIAETVGLDNHPWHEAVPPGFGIAQFDPPVDADDQRAIDCVERWGLGEQELRRFTTRLTCAVRDGLKLMRRGDEEVLYDLSTDPLELTPMPADSWPHADAVASLRSALEHPAVTATYGRTPPEPAAHDGPSAEEMQELEDRMRLLGYL